MTLPMLHSRGGDAQGCGGLSNATQRFDHVDDVAHGLRMYDYRTTGQASSNDNRTGGARTIFVHRAMDDRDLIREAIESGAATREALADALAVSAPSVGRLVRKERRLKADERDIAFKFLHIGSQQLNVRTVPLIGQIAASSWADAINDPYGHTFTMKGGPQAFALKVEGDSMDQIAPPGASVIIDPDDRELIDGRSYAVMNEHGETTLKRFRINPARFEPVSHNPNHKAILIGSEGFTLIGRAVEVTQEL